MKKFLAMLCCSALMGGLLAGCGNGSAPTDPSSTANIESDGTLNTTVYVNIAASLVSSFEEIVPLYNETQPNVTISINSGSSGKLMQEIEEAAGHGVDIFFSAGKSQVTQLDEIDGLVVDGTTVNLLQNELCLVTGKDSGTAVTGWEDLSNASNMALCDGSVPVGKYSREAFVSLGLLPDTDDNSAYTSDEVSAALGGVEINECANVGAVTSAVAEGSNEVGTVYYSDTYGLEDRLEILQVIPYDLTGDVIYPVAQVQNPEAEELESTTAKEFIDFLITDDAKTIFRKYYFDTDVEN